ncbi:DUF397 domain-containing protein [Actinomadura alba]|uniref:DUF397 domain-containing protein n=1 Tax=Actinomadura alba TaxID=406431 RepID=A0ABR7LN94_9ACTN|nr:DUF397 domain-containing protein [Actinomadura alba]MBC6466327.1 DUF397 domain-containing protein [Actinomadura alba]
MNQPPADERRTAWRKSSYSSGQGSGNCVEVAAVVGGTIAIRDSKDPHGPVHVLQPNAFWVLVSRVKSGDLAL